jgi:hypothetical protein
MSSSTKLSLVASVTAIAAVTAAIGTGTYASINDTEKQLDANSAGTLDINVDGENGTVAKFSIAEIVPGDSYSRVIPVSNLGDVDGLLKVTLADVSHAENGCPSEAELTAESTMAGGATCGAGAASELDDQIRVTLERRTAVDDPDTTLVNEEDWDDVYTAVNLTADQSPAPAVAIADADPSATDDTQTYRVSWTLPSTTENNRAMGDSAGFALKFDVEQLNGAPRTATETDATP